MTRQLYDTAAADERRDRSSHPSLASCPICTRQPSMKPVTYRRVPAAGPCGPGNASGAIDALCGEPPTVLALPAVPCGL